MTTNQLIKQVENKIQEIQLLISNYKNELTKHKNTLTILLKELTQIKQNI